MKTYDKKKWRSDKPQFFRLDKNRITCTNGTYLIKDNILGWLVYLNRFQYMKGCSDYKSFRLLKDAKKFAITDARRLLQSV